ncbi:MAG: transposase [Christensenellaceae bacterium]|jgi:hypothetical protein|nr:transposase [Christensenellaceae bacterium]
MSFNTYKPPTLNFNDTFESLIEENQRELIDGWAYMFKTCVFDKIDELPFEVLYSNNRNSRPCCPVKILIAADILKHQFNSSDKAIIRNIMFNIEYQYALGLTSCRNVPISERSLSRFRRAILNYLNATGIDLLEPIERLLLQNYIEKLESIERLLLQNYIEKLNINKETKKTDDYVAKSPTRIKKT